MIRSKQINQAINGSIEQAIIRVINQSINRSINQSNKQTFNRTSYGANTQSINQSFEQRTEGYNATTHLVFSSIALLIFRLNFGSKPASMSFTAFRSFRLVRLAPGIRKLEGIARVGLQNDLQLHFGLRLGTLLLHCRQNTPKLKSKKRQTFPPESNPWIPSYIWSPSNGSDDQRCPSPGPETVDSPTWQRATPYGLPYYP